MIKITPIDKSSKNQINDWIDLRLKLWPEHTREELKDEASEIGDKVQVWLAYDDDNPVGLVEAGERSVIEGSYDGPGGFVEGLYVESEYRNRGLAKELVKNVEAWARKQGFRQLGSNADLNNDESDKFHKAIGFQEVNRTINYIKDL